MTIKGADRYARLAFEFCEQLSLVDTADAIEAASLKALAEFGLSFATCAVVPPPGQSPIGGILMNNRPVEYLSRYAEKHYAAKDPVVVELKHTLRPYSWSDVRERRNLSKEQLAIMGEGTEFGANNGLIIPIVTETGSLSIFAPCGDDPNLSTRARSAVEIIGVATHQALRRAVISPYRPLRKPLSPREREVLKWLAAGKTEDEVGSILAIGRWTVHQHLKAAKQKLNMYNTVSAVVEALRQGEIGL